MDFKPWKTKKEEIVHQNPFFRIERSEFITPGGEEGEWFYHVNNGAVCVIGQLSDDAFVFIREYRYVHNRLSVAGIAGAIDQDERPQEAAQREFQEEAGYSARTMISLGTVVTAPSFSRESLIVFLARDLKKVEVAPERFEDIEPIILSRREVDEFVQAGEIWDSNAIAAWHLVTLFLDRKK